MAFVSFSLGPTQEPSPLEVVVVAFTRPLLILAFLLVSLTRIGHLRAPPVCGRVPRLFCLWGAGAVPVVAVCRPQAAGHSYRSDRVKCSEFPRVVSWPCGALRQLFLFLSVLQFICWLLLSRQSLVCCSDEIAAEVC